MSNISISVQHFFFKLTQSFHGMHTNVHKNFHLTPTCFYEDMLVYVLQPSKRCNFYTNIDKHSLTDDLELSLTNALVLPAN